MRTLIAALLALVALTGCGPVDKPTPTADQPLVTSTVAAQPAPTTKPVPAMTPNQTNAVNKAQSYLDNQAFSKSGLVKQLKYEGFSNEDSTFAVQNVTVDWLQQADKKAQSYLEFQAFSRSGLIKQLKYEGFTAEEAAHGADSVGLK